MLTVIFLDVCNLVYYLRQSAFACTHFQLFALSLNPITGLNSPTPSAFRYTNIRRFFTFVTF